MLPDAELSANRSQSHRDEETSPPKSAVSALTHTLPDREPLLYTCSIACVVESPAWPSPHPPPESVNG